MKVTKERFEKIVKEELARVVSEGEVDEALLDKLKAMAGGASGLVSKVGGQAASAVKSTIASAVAAKDELIRAGDAASTDADIRKVLDTIEMQLDAARRSLISLKTKAAELGIDVEGEEYKLTPLLRAIQAASTVVTHRGAPKPKPVLKKGVPGFQTGQRPPAKIRSRPVGQ